MVKYCNIYINYTHSPFITSDNNMKKMWLQSALALMLIQQPCKVGYCTFVVT